MPLGDHLHRSFQVIPDHLAAMRSALQSSSDSTLVTGAAIDALANRSTDTYIWHTRPNATHQESPLLRARMDESGIDPEARLAHGALGLIEALRVAYLQHPASPIRGFANVRYTAPVFEGARVTTTIQPDENGASGFEATTDQFEPGLAITGQIDRKSVV